MLCRRSAADEHHVMQVVATAGHVDHGKSALVRALTGREPDRLDEERRRGLTIDLGYVWTDLQAAGRTVTVAFVDVPGHDRFLTNMLAGVGAVHEVLFVVAADDGWSAQSEEHLEIVTVLRRRITAAVVTKAGPAGPTRTSEVIAQVRQRLARAGAEAAPVLAVDALDGSGLDELRTTLVQRLSHASRDDRAVDDRARDDQAVDDRARDDQAVDDRAVDDRAVDDRARDDRARDDRARDDRVGDEGTDSGPHVEGFSEALFTRLWIDRAFSVAGAGTVVTGTLTSGGLQRGDRVAVLPGWARGRIRDLRSLEVPVDAAVAPARVAVALAGVATTEVERGAALVGLRADDTPAGLATDAVDVWLEVLDHGPVGHRGAWQLHLGTAHRQARVLPLLGDLQPGEQGPARIEVEEPLPVQVGDRFVLREIGRRITAAGGTVLDPVPSRTRRGVTQRLIHAEALEAVHDAREGVSRAAALVALRGGAAALTDLEAAIGQPLGAELDHDQQVAVIDTMAIDGQHLERWQAAAVESAHGASAEDPVVTRDQLLGAAEASGCPRAVWPAVLRAAVASGEVAEVGGRLVHRDHLDVYLTRRDEKTQRLLHALAGPELACVDAARVDDEFGLARFELQPLIDDGHVLQHEGLLFTPDTVQRAVEALDAGPGAGGTGFTASDARRTWGLTRRFAVPLLEYLRATGRTTFDGTTHRRVAV